MAKEAPTATVTVDDAAGSGRAITNDVTNFSISTPRGIQTVTGVDSPSTERLLLLADGDVQLNGVFNDAATTGAHTVLSNAPTTTVDRTVVIATSGKTFTQESVLSDYQLTHGADGSSTWSAPLAQTSTTAPTWS